MTNVYLVSEEVLRRVLNNLNQLPDEFGSNAAETIHNILTKGPLEPITSILHLDEVGRNQTIKLARTLYALKD